LKKVCLGAREYIYSLNKIRRRRAAPYRASRRDNGTTQHGRESGTTHACIRNPAGSLPRCVSSHLVV